MIIQIEGAVETNKTHLDWLEEFTTWLESRGEVFAGGTNPSEE